LRPDLYFRISVIDAGLQLKTHVERYEGVKVSDAVRQLQSGSVSYSSLDYHSALEVAGEGSLEVFSLAGNRTEELRETIFRMAVKLRPFWARVCHLGRARVCAVISDDQSQCLRYAGLLESTDESVWRWWDRWASHFRADDWSDGMKPDERVNSFRFVSNARS